MKRITTIFAIVLLSVISFTSSAQKKDKIDREEWFRELQELKHEYLIKELDLNDEQKTKFFALYDAMENERHAIFRQVKKDYTEIEKKGNSASEADLLNMSEKVYRLKGLENDIEMKYFNEFKNVLSARQLFKLKKAEQEFSRVVRRHFKDDKHK